MNFFLHKQTYVILLIITVAMQIEIKLKILREAWDKVALARA